jgi:RNA polymerase sigma-70 factor, ECF subfamily
MATEETRGQPPEPYQAGSAEDFERLYRDFYPRLVRTVFPIVGDLGAAEDCVQDAFVKAYRAWPRYRPEREVGAWLYRIAINTAVSHRRRQRLRDVSEILRRLGRPPEAADPAEQVIDSELVRAMRSLPTKLLVAVVLRYYHGYSNREICEITGAADRTVGLRLAQARHRLRELLSALPEQPLMPISRASGVAVTCAEPSQDA